MAIKMNKGIWLMFACTILLAIAQFLLKIFSVNITNFFSFFNWIFLLGLIMLISASLLMTLAFKHGDLSSLYPVISLSFIWTFLLAFLFLHEQITWNILSGLLFIVLGVIFLGGTK